MPQDFFDVNKADFKSKSGSKYSFTREGVYRYSNHWGRVANCRWRLNSKTKIKNQHFHLGFAKWSDFFALNEEERQFYIAVDYENNTVSFKYKATRENAFLFFAVTAKKKVAQIKRLFEDDSWARYFEEDTQLLRKKIIDSFISSNKTLQEVKASFK